MPGFLATLTLSFSAACTYSTPFSVHGVYLPTTCMQFREPPTSLRATTRHGKAIPIEPVREESLDNLA